MFNTMYGLEQAVLDGRKTMTRKVITNKVAIAHCEKGYTDLALNYAAYQVGDVVAIAQSYMDIAIGISGKYKHACITDKNDLDTWCKYVDMQHIYPNAYNNKMFVKADLMPHHIRIINIRVERLQDISDEDCLREGIIDNNDIIQYQVLNNCFFSPREAFAYLIDKVSGKGTWERNPYVFVYEFEKLD